MSRAHGRELRGSSFAPRSEAPYGGRFGRMFRFLSAAQYGIDFEDSKKALAALAVTMIAQEFAEKDEEERKRNRESDMEVRKRDPSIFESEPEDENSSIPAGYTYLGQFIDHDLTFDPVSTLQAENDPDALEDFRTPRLDLDSIYGRGLADQPYLYDQDQPGKFLLGPDRRSNKRREAGGAPRPDVPRNGQNVALIGDPRNDENLVVVQLHALFLRFHNAIFDMLVKKSLEYIRQEDQHKEVQRLVHWHFAEAQRLVRWHYQWIVLHDFLPRIVGQKMALEVLNPSGAPNLRYYSVDPTRYPYMPVEFSVAAYRFGHSMVRPTYALNQDVIGPSEGIEKDRFNRVPLFTKDKVSDSPRANLNGLRPVPDGWGINWSFFFDVALAQDSLYPDQIQRSPKLPQPSYRIDTELVDPLGELPSPLPPGISQNSLALRNLLRGLALGLPSGQRVACALGEEPISDDVLWRKGARKEERKKVLKCYPQFANNAPLWFYILEEAERTTRDGSKDSRGGQHLGPVGGRVVAEVLVGLAYYDEHSFLRQAPKWRPCPPVGREDGTFDMARLIEFADQSAG